MLLALLICAFSLGNQSAPLTSNLAPDAFEGTHAIGELNQMTAIAGDHRPGGPGDRRLLDYLESALNALGGAQAGGYQTHVVRMSGSTVWGSSVETVLVGRRAGQGSGRPIVLLARRDGASANVRVQLSGAAALLQIATVLAQTETRHPIYVVFADGGSGGGEAAVRWLGARSAAGGIDAVIVLGDLGTGTSHTPLVQPFSTGIGGAPETLTRTLDSALWSQLGRNPGTSSLASQLAHLAFPLTLSEQGPIEGEGIPAASVNLDGEQGPAGGQSVSAARMQSAGRAVLSAFYALDRGGEVPSAPSTGLLISGRLVPMWSIALLILCMLIAPLAVSADAAVRMRRRGERVAAPALLGLLATLPFLLAAVTLMILGALGVLPTSPYPAEPAALGLGLGSVISIALALAAFAGGWWAWRSLAGDVGVGRGLGRSNEGAARVAGIPARSKDAAVPVPLAGRRSAAAAVPVLLAGAVLALAIWAINPYAALLMVPALHAGLLAACPDRAPRRRLARVALAVTPALIPLVSVALFYARSFGLGPAKMLSEAMGLVGGGYFGFGGTLLWSIAFGLLAALAVALTQTPGIGGGGESGAPERERTSRPSPRAGLGRPAPTLPYGLPPLRRERERVLR